MSFTEIIKNNLYNAYGWRTNRKLVLIESDDWGSIRTQSDEALKFISRFPKLYENSFNKVDALETSEDLNVLYECLMSFKDMNGRHPVITANFVTANPDFEKIRNSGFTEYFYEEFPDSYKTYYGTQEIFDNVKHGVEKGIFFPQFHGREHVHASFWMRDLKAGKTHTLDAFQHAFFAFGKNDLDAHGYLSAFNTIEPGDIEPVKKVIEEGLDLFEKIFGFRSKSVIAPQNTMHHDLLAFLKQKGVDIIQGARVHKQTFMKEGDKQYIKRFNGKINSFEQVNIVRNAVFEPSAGKANYVDRCMKEIETAFRWQKPAVICSHRYNYIGSLDKANRDRGISSLRDLLNKITKKWPYAEFVNTVELGDIIKESR